MGVYPTDREILIETEEARVYMARTYACNTCNIFYTPRPEKLLQEGDVYSLKFDEDRVAYEDYLEVLGNKAERTTNYKLNEYESDRLNGKRRTIRKKAARQPVRKRKKRVLQRKTAGTAGRKEKQGSLPAEGLEIQDGRNPKEKEKQRIQRKQWGGRRQKNGRKRKAGEARKKERK